MVSTTEAQRSAASAPDLHREPVGKPSPGDLRHCRTLRQYFLVPFLKLLLDSL